MTPRVHVLLLLLLLLTEYDVTFAVHVTHVNIVRQQAR